jgi:hypothetical protein
MSTDVIQNKICGLNMSLDRKTEYIYSPIGFPLNKFSFIHLCPNRENKSYNIGDITKVKCFKMVQREVHIVYNDTEQ